MLSGFACHLKAAIFRWRSSTQLMNTLPNQSSELKTVRHSKYSVFEMFHSFQGEGEFLGRSAFFIRLFGCPIQCPWCDSAGTWKPDGAVKIERISAEALAVAAAAAKPDCVVITGGEPTIYDLTPLCDALHAEGLRVHLETSGAFPIRGKIDWVTVSPKRQKLPLAENWARANEIKLIVDTPDALKEWAEKIGENSASSIWLHPEWSRSRDPEILGKIADWICRHGAPYRAGWQLHKLFNVR